MYALYVYNVYKFSITSLRPTDKDMYVLHVWYLFIRWKPFAVYIHALIVGSGGKKASARAPLVCIFKFTLHHSQCMSLVCIYLSMYVCMYVQVCECMYGDSFKPWSPPHTWSDLWIFGWHPPESLDSVFKLFRSVSTCLSVYVCMYVCM